MEDDETAVISVEKWVKFFSALFFRDGNSRSIILKCFVEYDFDFFKLYNRLHLLSGYEILIK